MQKFTSQVYLEADQNRPVNVYLYLFLFPPFFLFPFACSDRLVLKYEHFKPLNSTAKGQRGPLNKWHYFTDSHYLSAADGRSYERVLLFPNSVKISPRLLALLLLPFTSLWKHELFQLPEAVFASFPIKPLQRNSAGVLHNASKMQVEAELAQRTILSLTDCFNFCTCAVCLSQNHASFCICAFAAGPQSVVLRTQRRFISHDSKRLLAGGKWDFSVYSITTHRRTQPHLIYTDKNDCCCIQWSTHTSVWSRLLLHLRYKRLWGLTRSKWGAVSSVVGPKRLRRTTEWQVCLVPIQSKTLWGDTIWDVTHTRQNAAFFITYVDVLVPPDRSQRFWTFLEKMSVE